MTKEASRRHERAAETGVRMNKHNGISLYKRLLPLLSQDQDLFTQKQFLGQE